MKRHERLYNYVKVERDVYLRELLLPHLSFEKVEELLACDCIAKKLNPDLLQKLTQTCIIKRSIWTGGGSIGTSFSGALGTLILLPIDFAQFAYHAIKLAQELYALYGNKEMIQIKQQEDEEVLAWMLAGASGAISLTTTSLSALGQTLYTNACKKLSLHALSTLPILGCAIHGGMSAYALYALAMEFVEKLQEMQANQTSTTPQAMMKELGEIIDVEYHEVEESFKRFCNLAKLKELYAYFEEGYIDEQEFDHLKQELTA